MLFDTDVLIWALCGSVQAANEIDDDENRAISSVTYMELMQGARNKREQALVKQYLHALNFVVLPITEAISHRATVFIEEYSLKSGLHLADALVFATACEHVLTLCSANQRHFRQIVSLQTRTFMP